MPHLLTIMTTFVFMYTGSTCVAMSPTSVAMTSMLGKLVSGSYFRLEFVFDIICDRICKKVPFPHILHTSKQSDVAHDSLH